MIKRVLYAIVVLMALTACRSHTNEWSSSAVPSLALAPTFVATKTSATAFDDGDKVGVYVVKQGLTMQSNFNASDNILFQYFADGDSLAGVPTALFYPDRTTPVAIYAYYPYQPSQRDAFRMPFCVTADIKASDLCYATRGFQAPSESPLSLKFEHKLAKVMVGVTYSANVRVASIESVRWLGVKDSCSVNLSTGAVMVSDTHTADILSNAAFEAILPAQVLDARKLIEIKAKMTSGVSQTFYYNPTLLSVTLQAGKIHTFNLSIGDDNSVALVDNMVVAPWGSGATSAVMESAVDNTFTLHWMLPNADYANTSSIVFHIRDSRTGDRVPYRVSDLKLEKGHTASAATFTFSLRTSASMPLEYPYTIDSIDFVELTGKVVQGCKSIIAATIYRTGALTIGVEQDNLLMITTGTLNKWDSKTDNGIIAGGGVANTFQIQLLEQDYYNKVKSVRLTIDGAQYTFSGVTVSGNVLIAPLSPFDLPDVDGKSPTSYPFTIEKVEMIDASTVVLNTSHCNIEVARSGIIVFQVFNGTAFVPKSTVTAWGGAIIPSAGMDFVGPVSANPIKLIYCNGASTAECESITKMVLSIAGKDVTFPLAAGAMKGNKFAASLTSPIDIMLKDVTGIKPKNFPYTITGVALYQGNTSVASVDTLKIKVVGDGALTIQLMK